MRILHIINNLGSGGAEKLIEQLVTLMNKESNVQADVLLLTDVGNVFGQDLNNNGVNVCVVPLRNPKSPLNILYIRSHILKGNYDIVHAHLFPVLYWVSMASKLMLDENRPKFIFTEHSTHNRRRERGFFRFLDEFVYASYDRIVSVSDKVQKNLKAWLNLKHDGRFVTICNGIDLDSFKNALPYEKHQLSPVFNENTRLICMVGRFSEAKDQKTVIRGMEMLSENVHLLLVGEGPLKADCEKIAQELGLEHRIHFLGFRNDVPRILKTSDIVVLSSNWEGFGLVAVEAMAAGKPVVASNVPGLAGVVENYGVLFNPGDYDSLAQIVDALLSSESQYAAVAQACSIKANLYDIFKTVDAHIDVYQQILS